MQATAPPLGVISAELLFGFLVVLIGIAAQIAHLRPWNVVVRRHRTVVARFPVRGWRTSRVLIRQLRAHLE